MASHVHLTRRETGAILAGLRILQGLSPDDMQLNELELLNGNGAFDPLERTQIDSLCLYLAEGERTPPQVEHNELTDREAMDSIADELDGEHWGPESCESIAETLRLAGYEIRPPSEDDDEVCDPEGCVHTWNMTAGEADENNVSGEGAQVIRCTKCGENGDA
jgi:hypothetical protein